MIVQQLTKLIFDKGKEKDIEEMELYAVRNSSMRFNIYEGNLEDYGIAEENALSLRGIYKGKIGYAYTEKLAEDSIEELIENLLQYAENNDNKDAEGFGDLEIRSEKSESKGNKLAEYSEEEKISYLKAIEQEAYNLDSRVSIVDGCYYEEQTKSILIENRKGLKLEATHSIGVIGLSVVVKVDKDVQTGYDQFLINDLSEENKSKLVKKAVYDGVNMLGAESIDSATFEVILRNNVAADLFSFMSPVFLGSVVQKNLSKLKGRLGQEVGAALLNIVDNPLLENGKSYRTFDDEGTPTYSKYIIEKGVLKTFFHNTKTAQKDGVKSTGSGFRVSHKSSIDVSGSNMYIEEGKTTLEEIIGSLKDGIMITDVQGLHAGLNTVSGDFSLSSSGYLIKAGKIDKPISQITISGNFYTLMKDITMIGNDLKFCMPDMNYFGSPSLMVKCLTVAGK